MSNAGTLAASPSTRPVIDVKLVCANDWKWAAVTYIVTAVSLVRNGYRTEADNWKSKRARRHARERDEPLGWAISTTLARIIVFPRGLVDCFDAQRKTLSLPAPFFPLLSSV